MDCVSIKDQRTKDVPIAVLGVLDRRWEILDYGSFLVVIAQCLVGHPRMLDVRGA